MPIFINTIYMLIKLFWCAYDDCVHISPFAAVYPNVTFPIASYEYGVSTNSTGSPRQGMASENGQRRTSIIGGHVYRGCVFPNLKGILIIGDFTG